MKRILAASVVALLCLSATALAQNTNSSKTTTDNPGVAMKKKRGPVFKSTKDQIMQAQALLKQRNFYSGEATGKLDPPTREGLKKYQEAEGLKVTGTLNAVTLEKMSIPLTDRQKAVVAAQKAM